MSNMQFIKAVGIGAMAGTAIGICLSPRRKMKMNKTMKRVGHVVENITDAMGL